MPASSSPSARNNFIFIFVLFFITRYEFLLYCGETEIGRRSDNGISLPVLSVSKRHAKIDCSADGYVEVTDLGLRTKRKRKKGRRES